jgi:hypothetical protein
MAAREGAMRRMLLAAMMAALMAAPSIGEAKGKSSPPRSHAGYDSHGRPHAEGISRDSRGRIARSAQSKTAFKKSNPCPATGRSSGGCPGYVVDHVVPLKRGGADHPSNMQWQTSAAAKAKDRYE